MMSENWTKIYIIEIKIVSLSALARVTKKKGGLKNEADTM